MGPMGGLAFATRQQSRQQDNSRYQTVELFVVTLLHRSAAKVILDDSYLRSFHFRSWPY